MSTRVNRKLIHLIIRGNNEKLLPVYLHWQHSDNTWMVKDYSSIIVELGAIVMENLSDIERKARSDSKQHTAFHKLVGSCEESLLSAVYAVKCNETPTYSVLQLEVQINSVLPVAGFSLHIWVTPSGKGCSLTDLTIESFY